MGIERISSIVTPKQTKRPESKRAVIYTRVSTSKQIDNTSLEVQLERCREYCLKNGYTIVQEFGGTYESAKSDEGRKEFQKMLSFATNKKNDIAFIISFSPDRFSRTGGEAIELTKKLYTANGIRVLFASQDVDYKSSFGRFYLELNYLLSNLDNEMRKDKIISGMKEKLRQGYFVFNPPIGYSTSKTPGVGIPNDKAGFIQTAFALKEQGYSHDIISNRLRSLGFSINIKRLTEVFKNPYYCGYITSSLIDGEVVKGKHEAIISEETFMAINDIKVKYVKTGHSENHHFPLIGLIICHQCKKKWTGYTVKKKGIDYYKCNTRGCKCNRSAKVLHAGFVEEIRKYKIPAALEAPLKEQLKMVFDERNKSIAKISTQLEIRLAEIQADIKTVITRHATARIVEDDYKVALSLLNTDEQSVKQALSEANNQLSNHKDFINFSIELSQNIDRAWLSGNSRVKEILQRTLFPMGIEFNNHEQRYRTIKVNTLFELFGSLSAEYKEKEEEQIYCPSSNPVLVVPTGIEPVSKV